jgi:hypothetical protein
VENDGIHPERHANASVLRSAMVRFARHGENQRWNEQISSAVEKKASLRKFEATNRKEFKAHALARRRRETRRRSLAILLKVL